MRHDFKSEEIVLIERFDKKEGRKVAKQFPVVGGRLRLFHLDLAADNNEAVAGGIEIDVIKYKNDVAVIKAKVAVFGNTFTGIGMASKARDALIYPAILELAETRAIARALRFAGYGVEYTGAEEMPMDMLNGSTVKDDQAPETKEPVPHATGSEIKDGLLDLRANVWKHIQFTWKSYEVDDLADAMQTFMATVKSKSKDVTDYDIFKAILSRPDEFAGKFQKLLGTPEDQDRESESPAEERTSDPEVYKETRTAAADSMKIQPPDPGPSKDARKLKADIFMKLPAGVNAKAFNLTLEAVITANKNITVEQVYQMILDDFDEFVTMMVSFCAESNIDPGFSIEINDTPTPPPAQEAPKVADKKAYNEFHAQWVNLTWKPFNTFILKYCEEFRQDEDEYNAAVKKFDRLKVNNDAAEQRFPFLFKLIGESVSDDKSILNDAPVEGISLKINALKKDFPKMCQVVSGSIGIATPQNEKELELFVDEFDHQVMTYEAKHKKPYVE